VLILFDFLLFYIIAYATLNKLFASFIYNFKKNFTILEVAADCHKLMIPQRTTRPSTDRDSKQLDSGVCRQQT